MALYIVFGKRVAHMDGTQAVSWGMLAACFLALPLGVAHAGATLLEPHVLAVGVAIAVLSSGIPYLLEMTARAACAVHPARASSGVKRHSVHAMFIASSSEVMGEVPGLQSVATAIATPAARNAATGGGVVSRKK